MKIFKEKKLLTVILIIIVVALIVYFVGTRIGNKKTRDLQKNINNIEKEFQNTDSANKIEEELTPPELDLDIDF